MQFYRFDLDDNVERVNIFEKKSEENEKKINRPMRWMDMLIFGGIQAANCLFCCHVYYHFVT